ncbi:exodeoxyribonuclease V subunit gamma, partial [Ornithinicoccus halotolerans]|uniref:exodeoxyribonuclease V subunit gamma n=1 Tax=Ornithinicoccus halotolerans TaxID=1748220 RepID=UPI001885D5D3
LATATEAVAAPSPEPGAASGTPGQPAATPTLLGWLQHDVRRDETPSEAEQAARQVAPGDRSVQVHACHGPARQVEVLREVLAGLLSDDPTLEPRDILVMCPDIEAYAPLVHAGFGLGDVVAEEADGHPAHRLRVRLADRAPRFTNPLLAVAADLVRLAGGRVTASEVLDLARSHPVRWRFGLDEEDLERLAGWVEDAVIRWGLDQDHRDDYRIATAQNTWRFGLDRILTGAALDGTEVSGLGGSLALDDLDSGDVDLAGRMAELVDRLGTALHRLRECRTGGQWADALHDGVLALADVPARDAWQVSQLERELARLREHAATAAAGAAAAGSGGVTTGALTPAPTVLRLSDVAAVLEDRLGGRPTRANFRTGTLTVCTLVPMRSVPHRVVCLVGLDDGGFPRAMTVDGDDVLARTPVTGERDPRSEDRQLLLDAVMAARETLVVTYTGADEVTGGERPPAVPLGELVDAVETTATLPPGPDGGPGSVVVRHPLQPFDRRNLTPGALVQPAAGAQPQPFSFDRPSLLGARAAAAPRRPVTAVGAEPLPAVAEETVPLTDLTRFLVHPARTFLARRLGVLLPEVAEQAGEGIPIELGGLDKWAVGDRLLRDVLAGQELAVCREAELARGLLPPGALAGQVLDDVCGVVETLAGHAAPLREGARHAVDLDIDLGDGRRLVGTVPALVEDRSVTVTYSSVRAKQRLTSWVTLLALTAGHPGRDWTSHLLGRDGRYQAHITHGPVDPEQAREHLRALVDLLDRGMREPLPLPVETGLAFAEAVTAHDPDPLGRARWRWETADREGAIPGEQQDPAHVRLHGGAVPFAALLRAQAREDEQWFPGERTRLGQLARRVWEPVLSGPERKVRLR